MPFAPGQSGNPSGRPSMDPKLKEALQTYAKEGVDVLLGIMRDKEAANRDRAKAAEILMDRGWGKAVQTVDATLTEKKPLSYDEPLSAPDNKAT